MIKETTTELLLAELNAMPIEVLVKIFNFLPNHDLRCGVSLVCQKFYEICQDESLVPVKDLCIYAHPVGPKIKEGGFDKQYYRLSGSENLSSCAYGHPLSQGPTPNQGGIICRSKNLTFLKIKAMNSEVVNEFVYIALRACPKLTNLEIIEIPEQMGEYF